MLDDPDIGCRLGRKGDHHHCRIRSCDDNLDPEASTIQRNYPIRRVNVKMCISHPADMACWTPDRNPDVFKTGPLPSAVAIRPRILGIMELTALHNSPGNAPAIAAAKALADRHMAQVLPVVSAIRAEGVQYAITGIIESHRSGPSGPFVRP
jgi:hypothetical protein